MSSPSFGGLACETIRLDVSNEFTRVYIYCGTYGMLMLTIIYTAYALCGPGARSGPAKVAPISDEDEEAKKTPESKDAWTAAGDATEAATSVVPSAAVQKQGSAQQLEHAVEPADLKGARQHLIDSSPTVNGRWRGIFSTSLGGMTEVGGVGTELYFRLLLTLGMSFTVMSIVTSPTLIYSLLGNFVPDTGSPLAKTTVGNLGRILVGGTGDQSSRYIIVGCQGMDIKNLTRWFGYLDSCALLIFAAFIVHFRFRILPVLARTAEEEAVTVADFALEIEGLPRKVDDQARYEDLLREHLQSRIEQTRANAEKGGCCSKRRKLNLPNVEVHEVTLVRDFSKRLGRVKDRAMLMQQKKIAEFKQDTDGAAKVQAKIDKLSKTLEKVEDEEQLPVVRAYAIVNCMQDAQALEVQYRFANFFLFRLCQFSSNRFQGCGLRVRRAPEPSNIICENADVPKWERALRQAFMVLIFLIGLSIAGAITSYVTTGARDLNEGEGSVTSVLGSGACDADLPKTGYQCMFQNASTWTVDYARTLKGDALTCFCSTKGMATVVQDDVLRNELCQDWLVGTSIGIVVGIAASLIVVVLNAGFKMLCVFFSESERPLSVSALESSKMTKIFAAQFVNTALIILLVNYKSPTPILFLGAGEHHLFARGWFAVVGSAMVMTMLTNAFAGGGGLFGGWAFTVFYRRLCARRIQTQDELLQLYTNPEFDISTMLAQLLMTSFCTMLYSSAMPLLTVLAAIYCFILYWSSKALLLKGSRRPPQYDAAMVKQAAQILLFAIPVHLVFAIGAYSDACTFPSNPLGGALGSLTNQATSALQASGSVTLLGRLRYESTWLLTCCLALFIALVAIWLVLSIVGATFGEAAKFFLMLLCPKRAEEAPGANADLSTRSWLDKHIQEHLKSTCPPLSYGFESNPKFKPFVKYLKMNPGQSPAAEEQS
eukprot:TRINITY_DN10378_c0_g2_i1.p1 TRINITY_DN10378_c0_g2~~TRINITY_DN10378_c0_g2_i1.p1  ORF type:complete len:940 (-),score=180.77 TRINITY_DN10378_c0_g2_i1:179-2998(-)